MSTNYRRECCTVTRLLVAYVAHFETSETFDKLLWGELTKYLCRSLINNQKICFSCTYNFIYFISLNDNTSCISIFEVVGIMVVKVINRQMST